MSDFFSFKLDPGFIQEYSTIPPHWGYQDAAGNSLGEITFLRTYSRLKDDGTKERWFEVCERVINGMYSIQKDHAVANRIPWDDDKAQASAQEAYQRLFEFKWTPPGRGLWMMGTPMVHEQKNSAALQNCSAVSTAGMTAKDPSAPFAFMMEASMLGVGVGFDLKGADNGLVIQDPDPSDTWIYVVPDSREGWVESVSALIDSYFIPRIGDIGFDYSLIRPAGSPIKTFGGTAAGPDPLIKLHEGIRRIFDGRAGETLTSMDILDIGNLIGVCVVSGNVRRSAELAIGDLEDSDFLNAKNAEAFPERNSYDPEAPGWGWMSNNSVAVEVGDDLSAIAEGIARNGEPGVIWLDTSQDYGRLVDPPDYKDYRASLYNPCAEQTLESYEMCTLVETYIGNHEDKDDFLRTLKFAYLYGKTVTLLPTHWEKTNSIMLRNRRIGTSISGLADFVDNRSLQKLRVALDEGYNVIQHWDRIYSEWLGVRESIKTTTVKPSGTVSILAGSSPGVHWTPGGEYFERRIRFSKDDPMVTMFQMAGYDVQVASENPDTTVVVSFPIRSQSKRAEKEVSLFEKANLAAELQRYWSDNSVSVTLSFDPKTEGQHIGSILAMYEGSLKTVSFLPMGDKVYPQMPYESIPRQTYLAAMMKLFKLDLSPIYDGNALDAIGEAYCTTDACEVRELINDQESA